MYDFLASMVANGELVAPPSADITLNSYKSALDVTLKGYKEKKYMFKMY